MSSSTALEIKKVVEQEGYYIQENTLSPDFAKRAKLELIAAIEKEMKWHGHSQYSDYGMVLLCSLYGGSFLELLANEKLMTPFNAVLGKGCIIYAYTSSSMPPAGKNYSTRIHVDCPRLIPEYITNMGATILLDDFTEDNGATWFLPRSQNQITPPTEEDFYKSAKRLIAPAGSVLFFNARLWHSGGINKTNLWRHALTINMCRPFMKQRIDIPRAMKGMDLSHVPEATLQKLGFLAQVPSNYDEYYLPAEKRLYKQPAE